MKMKIDSNIVLVGLMLIVIVISVIGSYFFATMLVEAKQEVINTKEIIEAETRKNQVLDKISAAYQTVNSEGYVEKFETALPGEENFVKLIEELELITKISGGKIVKNLGEARLTEEGIVIPNKDIARAQGSSNVVLKGNGFAVVQIQATLRVSHAGFIEFLKYINDSPYFINIDSLFIRRVIIDGGDDAIDVGMVLNTYVNELKGL